MNLHQLNDLLKNKSDLLQHFFQEEFNKTPPSFYLSCDIRHSGFKAAVVDSNLFPAGFNNLCSSFSRKAVEEIRNYIHQYFPHSKNIIIFTEAHTRNKFYFENVARLASMIEQAGYAVKLCSLAEEIQDEYLEIHLPNQSLKLYRFVENETADLIISNNDFSAGIPSVLSKSNIPIVPSPQLGWFRRTKGQHFNFYNNIAKEVATLLQFDEWLISCVSSEIHEINLNERGGIESLAAAVENNLKLIQIKYNEYGIQNPPYVYVKNNSGTYGMGIEYFSSAEEVLEMGRRTRNKLLSSKGGNPVESFLIQEGIVTADSYSGYPIEPVVYMIGPNEIGGFFRINQLKDAWSSLNSKGMEFSCLCLHKLDEPHEGPYLSCHEKKDLLELSFFLGKVAALAAAREQKLIEETL